MTRNVTIACALILLLPTPGVAQTNEFTVATFNAEFLTRPKVHIKFGLPFRITDATPAEQAQWDAAFRDARFAEAAQAVAGVIAGIDADIVALTEVGVTADVNELNAEILALGVDYPHVFVGISPPQDQTRQHVALLSKFPLTNPVLQLPGREGFYTELDDADTEDDTGVGKSLRATFDAHGESYVIYVLHLRSEGGGFDADQQRVAQASIVRRHYVDDLRQDARIIVAGDLNDKRGQPTLKRIRGFDDVDMDLIQTGNTTFWNNNELDQRWTHEFEGVRAQIDHILLSPSIREAALQGGVDSSAVDHGNPLASDHRPLVVRIRLRDTP